LSESDIYWEKIINIWLIEIIAIIKLRYDEMKYYSKNSFYIYSNKSNLEFPFSSSSIYTTCGFSSDLNQFMYVKIAEILKIPIKNSLKNHNKYVVSKNTETNKLNKLFYHFLIFYVKFLKPVVLIDSYFNWKDKIKIFLSSRGKIIFAKSNNFFYLKRNKVKVNYKYRSTLKLKVKDDFDKVFNSIIYFFLPISFLEGFISIRKSISNYSVNIKKIGSAICSFCNDSYNILVAEMYKKKKNSILFAHGESDDIRTFDIRNTLAVKNSDLHITYGNKNGYGISNLRRLDSFFKYKKNYVLFISQNSLIHSINNLTNKISFEDSLKKNISFYEKLNSHIKSRFILRVSPTGLNYEDKSTTACDIIKSRFKDAIIDSKTDIKRLFLRSSVVISTYISTNVFESLYIDKPTIIITNLKSYNFNTKANLFFRKLQEVGVIYDNETKAALFLNKNYSNINLWWQSIKIRKILSLFKSNYCVDNKNFIELFLKNIL
jgi:putative transferase (TIGR04331 family)